MAAREAAWCQSFEGIIWTAGISYSNLAWPRCFLLRSWVVFVVCVCVCVCVVMVCWDILFPLCNLKFPIDIFDYCCKKPTLGRRAPTQLWTEYNSNCSQWVAFCLAMELFCLFALQSCSNEHLLLCR